MNDGRIKLSDIEKEHLIANYVRRYN